jgi:hypothetical protein
MNELWYFARGGVQIGPVMLDQLRVEIASGRLSRGDLVWRPGMAEWAEAGQVPELIPFFSASGPTLSGPGGSFGYPPPPPPPRGAPPTLPAGYGSAYGPGYGAPLSASPQADPLVWLRSFWERQFLYWKRLFAGHPEFIVAQTDEQTQLVQGGLQGRQAAYALWRQAVLWIASGFAGVAGTLQLLELISQSKEEREGLTTLGVLLQFLFPLTTLLMAGTAGAAAHLFHNYRQSFRYVAWGGGLALGIPLGLVFTPADWLVNIPHTPETTVGVLQMQRMLLNFVVGFQFYTMIMPLILSLLPALSRGCWRIKMFYPASIVPGWGMVASIPLFVLLTWATLVLIYHTVGNALLLLSLVLWIGAPLVYLTQYRFLVRPLFHRQDVEQLIRLQRLVLVLTLIGVILLILYLFTAKIGDKHLIGFDKNTSIVQVWDLQIHVFWMEYVGRLLFFSVLFADVVLQVQYSYWHHERLFRTLPEARDFDLEMQAMAPILGESIPASAEKSPPAYSSAPSSPPTQSSPPSPEPTPLSDSSTPGGS